MTDSRVDDLTVFQKAALQSGATTWQTREVTNRGIRPLFLSDGPHGIRKQAGAGDHLGLNASLKATCFPTSATVANSWDLGLARRVGKALGEEASALGVDVLLGPGLNIKRSPLGGRNFEYFSEDPLLSGRLAAQYVLGIQNEGPAACPKHFAVNSQETNRMTNNSVVDAQTLNELYLTGFEIVVREANPLFIMSSYNLVNGTYANENQMLLQKTLREQWGFDGVVVTDWGGSNDPVAAAKVGGGFEMPSPGFGSVDTLTDAVHQGRLSEDALNDRTEELFGVIDRIPEGSGNGQFDVIGHNELAREVAQQSTVLLKNEGGLLPLQPGTKVAVVGDFAQTPRYQGSGSSVVNPTMLATPLEAIAETELDYIGYAQGFQRDRKPNASLIDEALALTGRADVTLLYMGLDELSESEGVDRTDLDVPANQGELLRRLHEAGRKVVVVFSAGCATEMPWLEDCDALVHGYLSGQAGAAAMFDVLTGRVNPSGRLAETFPMKLSDTSTADRFPALGRNAEYREGPFIGYRYATTAEIPVLFPFGFGLSYTEFSRSEASVGAEGTTVTVTNKGDREGTETVQVYVGRKPGEATGVLRPRLKLAGFTKVPLAAGEAQTVTVPFDQYSFRHFNAAEGKWQVEVGEFEVFLGDNVNQVELVGTYTIGPDSPASVVGDLELVQPDPSALEGLPDYVSGQVDAVTDVEWERLLANPGATLPQETGPLGMNSPLSRMKSAKSPLARFAWGRMEKMLEKSEAKGKPDLNLLFLSSMPFRSIYNMSGGAASPEMVESMLAIVNGHFFKGTGGLIGKFFKNGRTQKALREEFDRQSGNESAGEKK